jgi:ankyrin repeat protein
LFVENKCDINICADDGQTPLILAVEGGHTEVVKLLVENKCDINICDNDGRTLLHRACRKGYADIAVEFA